MKIFLFINMMLVLSGSLWGLENNVVKVPDETSRVARDSNVFAFQLHQQLPSNSNVDFSPFSISSAFAMVYAGANGDTKQEIATVFHYPKSLEQLNKGWAWINKFLSFYPSNASDEIRLRIGNSLWIQTNFPVLPSFREMMSQYFDGIFRFVDFKSQPETARTIINAWVKQNTFGKIVDILPQQSIDNFTRMVLISAIYLKAKWKNQFDIHVTSQQPFFSVEGATKTTLSMTRSALFPYLDTSEVSILEMPYVKSWQEGPEFSMLIILPHQKDGLPNVEKGLNVEKLEEWIKNLKSTYVLATIPKFKTVYSINLIELFSKMGMKLPFSDQADFSGISDVKGLKIGDVFHKVYLSVDETGSEAAAATAIGLNATSILDQNPPVIFQVDHPFLYILFEKKTGMILFMGRVVDP